MKLPAASLAGKIRGLMADLCTFAGRTDALQRSDLDDLEEMAQRSRYLLGRWVQVKAPIKTLPGLSQQERRAAKRAAHREETARIREAVMTRAGGYCEACGGPATGTDPLVLDHMLGGIGRRRQRQSVETCWAIHGMTCHVNRTNNAPAAALWRTWMQLFLERHGYPVPKELQR